MTHDKWSAVDNEASCATICREDPTCAYFTYYPSLGCQTYKKDECTFAKRRFRVRVFKRRPVVAKDVRRKERCGHHRIRRKGVLGKGTGEQTGGVHAYHRSGGRKGCENSTCVLLGERNVCRKVQTIEDTNRVPGLPGRPCWIGYPAGCAKMLDDGSCPVVDIPAEYRGDHAKQSCCDPENGESLCAEANRVGNSVHKQLLHRSRGVCSYGNGSSWTHLLSSRPQRVFLWRGYVNRHGGAHAPQRWSVESFETCEDPLRRGRSNRACATLITLEWVLCDGPTLNDISDYKGGWIFITGQPDCGAATTEDECAMRGGSCWNAGIAKAVTVRRDAVPTNVKCSYRLDDHTFLFETDAPKIKGTRALHHYDIRFDVVLQSHLPTNEKGQY